jgi:S-adenosylmethionine hydrolase
MPIITLLTDFGTRDSYVAELRAVLVSAAPAATLVDVTHEVPAGDVRAAMYLLGRTWRRFPPGTIHLAVVDPGVGTDRRALALSHGGHLFVGPDNGLFTPVLQDATIVRLRVPHGAAPTFHGRDVFAPAAARLAGGKPLATLGAGVTDPVMLPIPAPGRTADGLAGQVVYVDCFGTLVTNLPGVAARDASHVVVGGEFRAPLGRTFSDVGMGESVAFPGSGETIEVAVRGGSAAQRMGAGVGTEVLLRR